MSIADVHAVKYAAAERLLWIAKSLAGQAENAMGEPREKWANSAFRYHEKQHNELWELQEELETWQTKYEQDLHQLLGSREPIVFPTFDEEPECYLFAASEIGYHVCRAIAWVNKACSVNWDYEPEEEVDPMKAVDLLKKNKLLFQKAIAGLKKEKFAIGEAISEEMPEPDEGPITPNGWQADGVASMGMPPTAWALVKSLWGAKGKSATIDELKQPVFGDDAEVVEVQNLRDHAKFANKFFRDKNLCWSVTVSAAGGRTPTASLLPPKPKKKRAVEKSP